MTAHEGLAPPGLMVEPDPTLMRPGSTEKFARRFVGGSPLRSLRVTSRGAELVAGWLDGRPIGDSPAERGLARRFLNAGLVHPQANKSVQIECTVVIPVRDDAVGLEQTLRAIGEGNVVVVDDGSVDGEKVVEIAGRYGAKLVSRASSAGPGAARMMAMELVSTPLVAFLDAGVVPQQNWIHELRGHFVDEAVVAVAPRVRSVPGATVRDRYEQDQSPLDLGSRPAPVGPGRVVSYVPSAALVVRREAFLAAGGFDPSLRFGEDVDLVWRLVAAGWVVRYDPSVEVTHAPRSSWRRWWQQRVGYGSSAAVLGLRHGGAVAPARGTPLTVAAVAAGAAGHPIVGSGLAGLAFESARRSLTDVVGADLATKVARRGLVGSARAYVAALTRVWWPITALVALAFPRSRLSLSTMIVVGAAADWYDSERNIAAPNGIALKVLDNLAYGVGVWRGCLAKRSVVALRPSVARGRVGSVSAPPATVRPV